MKLGVSIRAVRKQLDIVQVEFAKNCKLSQTELSQIENGIKHPSTKTVKRICERYGIPENILYLMSLEECDFPSEKKIEFAFFHPCIKLLAFKIIENKNKSHNKNNHLSSKKKIDVVKKNNISCIVDSSVNCA